MIIAIDGASRRNGKPDCAAAGFAYCSDIGGSRAMYESSGSTNQRGELMGCMMALEIAMKADLDISLIVTDSEYVFKALYNNWPAGWARKGWLTANGDPVKNQDLWKEIHNRLVVLQSHGKDILSYHIKGHLISLGAVTASNLISSDPSLKALEAAAMDKYDVRKSTHAELFEKAEDLFARNNGAMVDEETFKLLAVYNTVADYSATEYLEREEKKRITRALGQL